jgi:hypothetical protein
MKLLVWKDFDSSPLWTLGPTGTRSSTPPSRFNLPPELRARLNYMSAWYETYEPGSSNPEPDWPAYRAYVTGVAIDLKRHYGDKAQIFIQGDESLLEITGEYPRMMGLAG